MARTTVVSRTCVALMECPLANSQGLCRYIEQVSGGNEYWVVVGFDGRHNSREFAQRTAAAFLLGGAQVYLFSGLSVGSPPPTRVALLISTHPIARMYHSTWCSHSRYMPNSIRRFRRHTSQGGRGGHDHGIAQPEGGQRLQGVLGERCADHLPSRQGNNQGDRCQSYSVVRFWTVNSSPLLPRTPCRNPVVHLRHLLIPGIRLEMVPPCRSPLSGTESGELLRFMTLAVALIQRSSCARPTWPNCERAIGSLSLQRHAFQSHTRPCTVRVVSWRLI